MHLVAKIQKIKIQQMKIQPIHKHDQMMIRGLKTEGCTKSMCPNFTKIQTKIPHVTTNAKIDKSKFCVIKFKLIMFCLKL